MLNNSATLDGGALSLMGGSVLVVEDEGCSASCDLSRAGDGLCDPSCMSRGCNWYGTVEMFHLLKLFSEIDNQRNIILMICFLT